MGFEDRTVNQIIWFAANSTTSTQPQLSSFKATERWSLLVVLMTWQLWLARKHCLDHLLPWQRTQDKLSPGRVAQAFASMLAAIGTPAKPLNRAEKPPVEQLESTLHPDPTTQRSKNAPPDRKSLRKD